MLTDHDEFLHLGYPKGSQAPWKENYYFNFCDRKANALGIIHASLQRDKGVLTIRTHQVLDGKQFNYVNTLAWPPGVGARSEQVVLTDGALGIEVLEPFNAHRIQLTHDELSMTLNYRKRFEAFDYPDAHSPAEGLPEADKAMDVKHYEQGMTVEGTIDFNGKRYEINCLGHRDHTWGFRDESGLRGWNWVAMQGENSSINLTQVRRRDWANTEMGFISYTDKALAVTAVEVADIRYNELQEPVVTRYAVTLEDDSRLHITATRFTRMFLDDPKRNGVIFHENFSEFVIEETGEKGVGVDEHMLLVK
ncbi:hypothetical protein SAMN05216296_1440 [Pseudomonas pohangensis]|uniref:DUF7065 domain-containing protein n=1 Tax=Pseudomonas pohangensis TaxID=364197 RepID=A0A1H2FA80_9PSED|nr:hypothetical protein [Pseudomonas pohangensis]SDU04261.1 hypothetical protein SAMN05216296_1440 [Pseudomonas pohangensis]